MAQVTAQVLAGRTPGRPEPGSDGLLVSAYLGGYDLELA